MKRYIFSGTVDGRIFELHIEGKRGQRRGIMVEGSKSFFGGYFPTQVPWWSDFIEWATAFYKTLP